MDYFNEAVAKIGVGLQSRPSARDVATAAIRAGDEASAARIAQAQAARITDPERLNPQEKIELGLRTQRQDAADAAAALQAERERENATPAAQAEARERASRAARMEYARRHPQIIA
jgi:hypothetical protein